MATPRSIVPLVVPDPECADFLGECGAFKQAWYYYQAVDQRRFADAYRFWNRSAQQQMPVANFVRQYDDLQRFSAQLIVSDQEGQVPGRDQLTRAPL